MEPARRESHARRFWTTLAVAIVVLAAGGVFAASRLLAPRVQEPVKLARGTAPVPVPPRPAGGQAVPVLMYHHVMPVPNNSIAISPAAFDAQMRYLYDNGWHPVSMAQMRSFVLKGTRLPSKPVLVTFDDGRMNQLTYGVPILKKYGFTATFFIVKKWAESADPAFMHVAQLRELVADGHDVESHTANHWLLSRKHSESYDTLKARAWDATFGMRGWMSDALKTRTVVALAYPGGRFDDFAMRLAREAGYELAFTTKPGYVTVGGQSQFALPRWNVGARGLQQSSFVAAVTGAERYRPGALVLPPPWGP